MKGAGGTSGGIGKFFLGFFMMCGGFYLLLNSIFISSSFGMGMHLYGVPMMGGYFDITAGMVLIPFLIGIGMIFYNGGSILGWLLTLGSFSALILGVISSIQISFRGMTLFNLLVILILAIGGLGMFLGSLRDDPKSTK